MMNRKKKKSRITWKEFKKLYGLMAYVDKGTRTEGHKHIRRMYHEYLAYDNRCRKDKQNEE